VFKILSAGWNCAEFMKQTIESIESQRNVEWEAFLAYEANGRDDEGWGIVMATIANDPDYFRGWANIPPDEYLFDIQNRVRALQLFEIEDDDIIVFLDLDGDKFAHPYVLDKLTEYYSDGTLTTYGSYDWEPHTPGPSPALPFPEHVVHSNTYRNWIRANGQTFNHLRTMKGRIFNNIPVDNFKWPGTNEWYRNGTDYLFTVPALELAGGRYKCIEEVLMIYNEGNPLSNVHLDWRETVRCVTNYLQRPAYTPLP
jgi:hypothetical protein